jgi:mono/diheme cytochrome c family protein
MKTVAAGAAALAIACCAVAGVAALPPGQAAQRSAGESPDGGAPPRALVKQYCVTCHNTRTKTAGLMLDASDVGAPASQPEVWEKVVRKVRAGQMPPAGMPRPAAPAVDSFLRWVEGELDAAAAARPNPGRPLLHRLNRVEYANAIRDLLDLEVDVTPLLPPDDSSHGFDNVADVLGVSPLLQERYLAAADRVSSLAVGDPRVGPGSETFRVRQDLSQDQHIEGLPLGTIGGVLARPTLPLDGEYVIQVKLMRTNTGAVRGLEWPRQLEILVDGRRVHLAGFGGDADLRALYHNPTLASDDIDARLKVRVRLPAGPHQIGAAFLKKTNAASVNRLQPFLRASDTIDTSGMTHMDFLSITGPFEVAGSGETPSRRRVFTCRPVAASEEAACAGGILGDLARRAYRRPATSSEVQELVSFFRAGRASGGTFDAGIQMGLRLILASPKFVFRAEADPANARAGAAYPISDLELASRLSFFLWSSIPDDTLLDLAARNQLRQPGILAQQVRRMLADARATALVQNFAGQWLYVRNVRGVLPDSNVFPDFDDNLRQALQREVELFFGSIVREDRSVLDLLRADYTFVNERLARHYGIPHIYGSQFRRVTVTQDARKGLLGKGAILAVTSNANRTSPVKRGKWILENLVGIPPAPPPPDVPPLPEEQGAARPLSMRERMEVHRASPVCANCHKVMDPLGFALENFDAVGAWREREGTTAIDPSGPFWDGTQLSGASALREALLARPTVFVQTTSEKLLVYALGRGLSAADMPAVRRIMRESASQDHRFSSIVLAIATSTPFQMRARATP